MSIHLSFSCLLAYFIHFAEPIHTAAQNDESNDVIAMLPPRLQMSLKILELIETDIDPLTELAVAVNAWNGPDKKWVQEQSGSEKRISPDLAPWLKSLPGLIAPKSKQFANFFKDFIKNAVVDSFKYDRRKLNQTMKDIQAVISEKLHLLPDLKHEIPVDFDMTEDSDVMEWTIRRERIHRHAFYLSAKLAMLSVIPNTADVSRENCDLLYSDTDDILHDLVDRDFMKYMYAGLKGSIKDMSEFIQGIIGVFVPGIVLHILFLKHIYTKDSLMFPLVDKWYSTQTISSISKLINQVFSDAVDDYLKLMEDDVEEFEIQETTYDTAEGLFDLLSHKYYFRDISVNVHRIEEGKVRAFRLFKPDSKGQFKSIYKIRQSKDPNTKFGIVVYERSKKFKHPYYGDDYVEREPYEVILQDFEDVHSEECYESDSSSLCKFLRESKESRSFKIGMLVDSSLDASMVSSIYLHFCNFPIKLKGQDIQVFEYRCEQF